MKQIKFKPYCVVCGKKFNKSGAVACSGHCWSSLSKVREVIKGRIEGEKNGIKLSPEKVSRDFNTIQDYLGR